MKKNKLLLTALFVLTLSVAITISAVFAFYYFETNNPIETDFAYKAPIDGEGKILVSSEYALRIIANNTYFLEGNNTSESGQRKIIKLTDDILLTKPLIIENDLNIEFNGYFINLNGNDLTIRHNYYGSFLLNGTALDNTITENGGIKNTAGVTAQFNIETPNSKIEQHNFVCPEEIYNILSFDFDRVSTEIKQYLDKSIDKYYIDDLPLLFAYKNYPISFSYLATSNIDTTNYMAVTQYGRVTRPDEGSENANVAITLTLTNDITNVDTTHIINTTILPENSDFLDIGKETLDNYFNHYILKNENDNTLYSIFNPLKLIKENAYFGLTYEYKLNNIAFTNDSLFWIFNAGEEIKTLTVTINNTQKGTSVSYEYDFTLMTQSNIEIVNDIIKNFGVFRIYNIDSGIYLNSGKTVKNVDGVWDENLPEDNQFTSPNIKNVTFTLDYIGANYYDIDAEKMLLSVKKLPSKFDVIYLTYTFYFYVGEPITITKNVRIQYSIGQSGGEEGDDPFASLYEELLAILSSQVDSNGETYKSVYLPSALEGVAISYIIKEEERYSYLTQTNGTFIFDITKIPTNDTSIEISLYFDDMPTAYYRKPTLKVLGLILETRDIKDSLLFSYLKTTFDANTDNYITSREANEKNVLDINLSLLTDENKIATYQGLEFFKSIPEIILDSININDLFSWFKGNSTEIFSIKNSSISKSVVFSEMSNLKNLSMINCNLSSINNILPYYPNLINLDLSNNSLLDFNGVDKQLSLQNITVSKNETYYGALLDMNSLKNIYIIDCGVFDDADKVDGKIKFNKVISNTNLSIYVMLYRRGIRFYADGIEITQPDADTEKGAIILESIFYTISGDKILLPKIMGVYNIVWKYEDGSSLTAGDSNYIILNNLSSDVRVIAYVIINGVISQRLFIINA